MRISNAEYLLQELGITEPNEIDLEAIAYYVNARIKYRPLDGCEARIIGNNNNAIITVNSKSSYKRKRFSIAHELGHWHHHRGKCLSCRADEYQPKNALSPERIADNYAADLLMPNYLFHSLARQYKGLNFKTVDVLAETFNTSQTATAIRLIETNYFPALLVSHGPNGRRWFIRAKSVPEKWFPQDSLDPDSFAFDIQFGKKNNNSSPLKIGADAWFNRYDAEHFEMREQTIRTGPDETLSLLLIDDSKMLDER